MRPLFNPATKKWINWHRQRGSKGAAWTLERDFGWALISASEAGFYELPGSQRPGEARGTQKTCSMAGASLRLRSLRQAQGGQGRRDDGGEEGWHKSQRYMAERGEGLAGGASSTPGD